MNVSIITRLTDRHLDAAALAETWTNAIADGAGTPDHPHLARCAECRVRYAAFAGSMNELRTDALAEADEIFTPERLKAQQAQIFRRLEAAEQPTRIIAFPKAAGVSSKPSPFRRWVAAAAAAGLVAGIGLGQIFHFNRADQFAPVPQRESNGAPSLQARGGNPAIVPASYNEEVAFRELDDLAVPRYDALRAYDTFTPRAADSMGPR